MAETRALTEMNASITRYASSGELNIVTPSCSTRPRAMVRFNSNTASAQLVWRHARYETLRLPSTSPAHTRPLLEKLAQWGALGRWLP